MVPVIFVLLVVVGLLTVFVAVVWPRRDGSPAVAGTLTVTAVTDPDRCPDLPALIWALQAFGLPDRPADGRS